ncbi:MAG: PIG-L family deacetylase [Gammaproteobacteria bacterium]|nr:PIG-L family deacetylase [Gammaproteobacteria bacterium]
MKSVLVVAPHPDDETLGCGGTLLRLGSEGAKLHWLIATEMTPDGYSAEQRGIRDAEIVAVAKHYGFASLTLLGLPAARLDSQPRHALVAGVAKAVADIQPDTVFLPNPGDVHTDHTVVFEACQSALKWTRAPWVRRVSVYETLSETDLALSPRYPQFRGNSHVDISATLDGKVAAMQMYRSEVGAFPFPRSPEAMRAQAATRGAAAGFRAAEAFMILSERW